MVERSADGIAGREIHGMGLTQVQLAIASTEPVDSRTAAQQTSNHQRHG
ncbi:hypothetical protein [Pseudomonas sp. Fl4BN1]|nr:hypothetical protein [Pseudomonas sp. Fl4BN1]NBF13219.1 hypothetical protein [Pseudomonas sp. Fl4BN1]